jgi:hypothetical protein
MKSLGSYGIQTGDTICVSDSETIIGHEELEFAYLRRSPTRTKFKARYAWDGNMNVSGMIPGTASEWLCFSAFWYTGIGIEKE